MKRILFALAVFLLPLTVTVRSSAQNCPDGVESCYITVNMLDGYGDGWDGGAVLVYQGNVLRGSAALPYDDNENTFSGTATVGVCANEPIELRWSSDEYDEECSFTVLNADGVVVATGTGEDYSDNGLIATVNTPCGTGCIIPGNLRVGYNSEGELVAEWNGNNEDNYYYSVLEDGESVENATFILSSGNSVVLDEAEPGEYYTVYVYHECSDGNSDTVSLYFHTPGALVTEFPYSTGFESEEDRGWDFINGYNQWFIGTATSNLGTRSLYISSSSNGANNNYSSNSVSVSYAVRKFYAESVGEWTLSYDWKAQGESTYDYCRVWIAPADFEFQPNCFPGGQPNPSTNNYYNVTPTGFIDGATSKLNLSSTWVHVSQTFSISTADTYQIVFMWCNDADATNNPAIAIDNVMLAPLTCSRPNGVTFDTISTEEITFHWNPANEESEWSVTFNGVTEHVTSPQYTATGLSANTEYTIRVRSICSDEDSSDVYITTVRTPCGAISALPWTEGFESFSAASSSMATIPCWDLIRSSNSSSYIAIDGTSSRVHTGARSMAFSGYAPTPIIAIFPPFEEELSNLELSFYCLAQNNNSGTLRVGYLTNPADTSSFVVMATYPRTHTSYGMELVSFVGAPAGSRIAIQHTGTSSSGKWWIDDINVHIRPACAAPSSVVASNITTTSATLTIISPDEEGNFHIVILNGTDTVYNEVENGLSHEISTLSPSTTYTVVVTHVCDDQEETSAISYSFSTECGAIETFPWMEPFSSSNSLNCWTILDLDNNTNDNWSYNNYGYVSASYNDEATPNDWLITPAIALPENAEGLVLRWKAMGDEYEEDNVTHESHVTVRLSTSAYSTDTASFSTIISSETIPSDVWTSYSISLNDYAGDTIRVAFIHDSFNDDGPSIDSVYIYNSTLPEITLAGPSVVDVNEEVQFNVTLTAGSASSLTYTWTSVMEAAGNAVISDSANVLTVTYSATGLDTITVVAQNAYGSASASMAVQVRNCNGVSDFPYVQDFENGLGCWSSYDNGNNGRDWYPSSNSNNTSSVSAHSGNTFYYSESYDLDGNTGSINVDNWLISPAIVLPTDPATLKWYTYLDDDYYSDEHYAVYVSTTGSAVSSFTSSTPIYEHTCSSAEALVWNEVSVSLAQYAGQTVRIAFRHYNCYDQWFLGIDDISVSISGEVPPQSYTVSVSSNNTSMGTASCTPSGSLPEGTSITATATPLPGYEFVAWMDGSNVVSTDNPYTFTLTANTALVAEFVASVGIEEAAADRLMLFPNPASSAVTLKGITQNSLVSIVDVDGRQIFTASSDADLSIDISSFARGAYYVRVVSQNGSSVMKLIVK